MSSTFKCHGCGCAASQVVTVCDSCASKLEGSTPSASTNTGRPKLPDESTIVGLTMESFLKETFVYKEVTHLPSFRAGARAYHEFIVRQLRAIA